MRVHGDALSEDALDAVSLYLGKDTREVTTPGPESCSSEPSLPSKLEEVHASGWDSDASNTRLHPAGIAGLTARNLPRLELAWAFGFPDATRTRSLPAVAGDTLFVGSEDGRVYALDRETGCMRWSFWADAEVRNALSIGSPGRGLPPLLFFGDAVGSVYALEPRTGELEWTRKPHPHEYAAITGSPRLHDGRLYVPISSFEPGVAMNPRYACCTFRGAVVALDAATGERIWIAYTVPEARPQGRNLAFAERFGPSGAPVWTSPSVDSKRRLVYFASGQNYSHPASEGSDAVFAVDLDSGEQRWVRQATAGDVWTTACDSLLGVNCPSGAGQDLDFGASPILIKLEEGRDVLVAAQKSGVVFGLDPSTGEVRWQTRVGRGGSLGGVHWGIAGDRERVYVPVSDRNDGRDRPDPAQPGLVALDPATGAVIWRVDAPETCADVEGCYRAFSAAPAAVEGAVLVGGLDGWLRAYGAERGELLWEFPTSRSFTTTNGVRAHGGAIDSSGPLIADGWVYANSGYGALHELPGNVLLAFKVPGGAGAD